MSERTPHHSEPAREAVRGELPIWKEGWIAERLSAAMHAYLADYVWSPDEGCDHEPTDFERMIMEDMLNGALSAPAVASLLQDAAFAMLPSPAPAASGGLEAVREAMKRLEEQERDSCWHPMYRDGLLAAICEISAALAAPAATGGEAVAWRFKHKHYPHERWRFNDKPPEGEPWTKGEPLYTHPAPSETGASVGVKALDWEGGEGDRTWFAFVKEWGGFYRAIHYPERRLWSLGSHGMPEGPMGKFATLDEAKAAAQADFETRIRAALEGRTGQMVLVPREPTEAMMDAAIAVTEKPCFPQDIYRAMIDAAGGRDE